MKKLIALFILASMLVPSIAFCGEKVFGLELGAVSNKKPGQYKKKLNKTFFGCNSAEYSVSNENGIIFSIGVNREYSSRASLNYSLLELNTIMEYLSKKYSAPFRKDINSRIVTRYVAEINKNEVILIKVISGDDFGFVTIQWIVVDEFNAEIIAKQKNEKALFPKRADNCIAA